MIRRHVALMLSAILGLAWGAARAAEPAPNPWRQMARQDLAFAAATIADRYIYARTPGGPAFDKLLADANRQADLDVDKVDDATRRCCGATPTASPTPTCACG
jgi:hypothetical protein